MTRIARLRSRVLNVSAKTNWFFVELLAQDGGVAWGEASLNGREPELEQATVRAAVQCVGLSLDEAARQLQVDPNAPGGLAANAVVSAVQQAVLGLLSRQAGVPAHALLGTQVRADVAAYANINRATTQRDPAGFVATARRAQQRGFNAFKAAPFDGVTPHNCGSAEGQARIHHGIDCLLALRDAIGPAARLMVDCHWRFDEACAVQTLHALAPARLHWFECPLAETPAHWPALRRIRAAAREHGVLLAAAETQVGRAAFQTLFDEGLYDVVMPDVKYCGGPREMLRIAQRAADAGVQFSPHNPTGPVCSQYSLHVAAVAPECGLIELQIDESPLFDTLVGSQNPGPIDGMLTLPLSPGLGLALDQAMFAAHPYRPVPLGMEAASAG